MTNGDIVARLALSVRDQELAQTFADELSGFGFFIKSVTPRGVMFEGRASLFEKYFNVKIEIIGGRASFATPPVFPERLKGTVESVYFPTKPTFF